MQSNKMQHKQIKVCYYTQNGICYRNSTCDNCDIKQRHTIKEIMKEENTDPYPYLGDNDYNLW